MLPIGDIDVYRRTTPYIILGIIGLNVLIFLYELSLGGSLFFTNSGAVAEFFYQLGVVPHELTSGEEIYGSRLFQEGKFPHTRIVPIDLTSPIPTWGTAFSSMFIHGGWLHLIGNMLYLWVFGSNIEDKFGHIKFLLFYLGAGLAAVWTQVLINPDSQAPMIGASGAVSGVAGAYLVLFPFNRIRTLIIFFFIMAIELPAMTLLGFWFILQLFQGVGSLGPGVGVGGVAHWAHVGGFLMGSGLVVFYKFIRGDPIWPSRQRRH